MTNESTLLIRFNASYHLYSPLLVIRRKKTGTGQVNYFLGPTTLYV